MFPTAPPVPADRPAPAHAVRQALDEHDHLVVTGGPGQGKSTLSLRLAADIATAWTEPTDKPMLPGGAGDTATPDRTRTRRPDGSAVHASAREGIKAEYGALLAMELTAPLLPSG